MAYRWLALDIDGTLLDPYGELTPSARAAVARARRRGLEVVLCTGRRFRTALPVARELGLEGPLVVNNGALVKEAASARTLHRALLAPEVYPEALALLREVGTPLVYVDRYESHVDFLTQDDAGLHRFQVDYLEDHAEHCGWVGDLAREAADDVIMLSMMADAETLARLRARAEAQLGPRVASHLLFNKNYEGHILELFSPESGKWRGLERLARAAGVAPEEIAAVGDDANDAELLARVGLGIAMGNAVPEARLAAKAVVRSNAEGGVVEAIEQVLRS